MFYSVSVNIESSRTETSTLEVEEWIVTKIVPLGVYLKQKIERVTWGKLSTKNGDYGFLPNTDPIWRKFVGVDEEFKDKELFKTKTAAMRSSLPWLKKKANELNRLVARVEKLSKNQKR